MGDESKQLELLKALVRQTRSGDLRWETLPEYLEKHRDDALETFIMYCNPYVSRGNTLLAHESYRVQIGERCFLLLRRSYGFELGIVDPAEGVTTVACDEREKETLRLLMELVAVKKQARRSAQRVQVEEKQTTGQETQSRQE